MRAIALSATSVLCLALLQGAGAHDEVIHLVASMAAGLSTVNVPLFMDAFDKDMPDYDRLRGDVTALTNQAEVTSSIEPVSEQGGEDAYSIDLDWYLQVRSLVPDGPIVTRRQVVHCDLRKDKKRWVIVAIKPMEFFAPAKLGR